jgi:hypothetical protein
MQTEIIMCSSLYCPYKDQCGLHNQPEDDDNVNQTYLNYEYTCCQSDGFSFYIPLE